MMKEVILKITENVHLTENVLRMKLKGDLSAVSAPGQFVNLKISGLYLRRPISVCDLEGDTLTLIYKVVGKGTEKMSLMKENECLSVLTGLGNGYDTSLSGDSPLLLGGGVGIPPLYLLAKKLISEGKSVTAILGFNKKDEVFLEKEFKELGCKVTVTTADGSYGTKGFVTDAMDCAYSYFYACGPEPMLKAVYKASKTGG
ncbi:MAG: dihydroorotate dehydrogenase electron transfer subunit, partial [Clostridia bacterium]|nr:dihydroorotate dehydrogenase electron transfer subunit [Clostridia bacterium]